jgi:hypothetical protein
MCSCRSPLRRACPPPPHIKKAFDLRWYNTSSMQRVSKYESVVFYRAAARRRRAAAPC